MSDEESDGFDPYHVWLGIPPELQPANHYRLLGIEMFESSADVIDTAANRQTAYLHQVATGPRRQESQKLLNEIAGARRCLLDAKAKAEYDAELRTTMVEEVAPVEPIDNAGDDWMSSPLDEVTAEAGDLGAESTVWDTGQQQSALGSQQQMQWNGAQFGQRTSDTDLLTRKNIILAVLAGLFISGVIFAIMKLVGFV